MATLTKDRARKPICIARPVFSYGMNAGFNNGEYGVTIRLNEGDSGYTLRLTDAELDKAVALRAQFDDRPDPEFTANVISIASDEIEGDKGRLNRTQQLDKALRMAMITLRSHMTKTEQARNATLAYIEKVINNG